MADVDVEAEIAETPSETLADCLARVRHLRLQVERLHGTSAATGDSAALLRALDGLEALLAGLAEVVTVPALGRRGRGRPHSDYEHCRMPIRCAAEATASARASNFTSTYWAAQCRCRTRCARSIRAGPATPPGSSSTSPPSSGRGSMTHGPRWRSWRRAMSPTRYSGAGSGCMSGSGPRCRRASPGWGAKGELDVDRIRPATTGQPPPKRTAPCAG